MTFRRNVPASILLLALILAGCAFRSDATSPLPASRIDRVTLKSQSLDKRMRISVYLPKGYVAANHYPVLYMLHGFYADEKQWESLGLFTAADRLIEKGDIQPVIIVTPQLDNSFGINSATTAQVVQPKDPINSPYLGRYEDYLYKDLVTFIDHKYATVDSRPGRWIGGLSMGGYAAVNLAFHHSDLFSKVGSHSGAIYTEPFAHPGVKDWVYTEPLRSERDPLLVAGRADVTGLSVYLDCGSGDPLRFFDGLDKLNAVLTSRGVKSEFHLNGGGHDEAYWTAHLEEYLRFYAAR